MQMIHTLVTLLLVSLASAEQKIDLFIKPIDEPVTDSIGFINDNSVYFVDNTQLDPSKKYCVGTKDLENHECFTFVDGVTSLNGTVLDAFIDENGEISRLALNFDDSSKTTIRDKLRRHKLQPAAVPNMNAESIKKLRQQAQQAQGGGGANGKVNTVKQKKLIKYIDDDGNEVEKEIEEEVEVDERSWIQKNWMYIVPPLLLFLVLGGDGK
ncbi:hypothetical protein Cantr_01682 [Candida viswanathii]|uniref:ER membrane protein complex subunit 10 n=1 Tax=Candida viswanathii TaxID=5486 RepID=A0A367YJQ2_9ASCO|nr:hypothetical protein Cantr_01682 [Candida viswanathii]